MGWPVTEYDPPLPPSVSLQKLARDFRVTEGYRARSPGGTCRGSARKAGLLALVRPHLDGASHEVSWPNGDRGGDSANDRQQATDDQELVERAGVGRVNRRHQFTSYAWRGRDNRPSDGALIDSTGNGGRTVRETWSE